MTFTRRHMFLSSAALALTAARPRPVRATAAPTPLRIAVLKFGTVNWELETIRSEGLDSKHGVEVIPQGIASSAAAKIAFEGGQADMLVADWIWVARQRAAGRDYVFAPYSRAVGGIMVPGDSPLTSLQDLRGKRIGIAGGPLDKSWLIFQAHAALQGFDLAREAEPVFGAPPLIMRKGLTGGLDAVLNYWHFSAKMRAQGFRTLINVADAAREMGAGDEIPLLGYVFREELAANAPEAVTGFLAASRDGKALLASSDAAWDALRPRMNAASEAEFTAMRDGFRAGIPNGPVDRKAAAALFAILSKQGGNALVGNARTLPDGVFYGEG